MLKRQLVLVAIDHATNVERTMEAALGTAKARGADVHAIQVVPHRAVPVDDRPNRWPFAASRRSQRRHWSATRIDAAIGGP